MMTTDQLDRLRELEQIERDNPQQCERDQPQAATTKGDRV